MIDQAALDEVFSSNPLREVVVEVRFDTNLRIFPQIYYVQEDTSPDYTRVFREQDLLPDSPGVVTNYAFENPETERIIKVWENKITVGTTKYETFESFSKEALSRIQNLSSLFKIKQFTRIGLRYVNNIALPRDSAADLLRQYTRPYFEPTTSSNGQLMQFKTEAVTSNEKCLLGMRTGLLPVSDDTIVYILDLDAFVMGTCDSKDLRTTMIDLHHQVQQEFLSHITDAYKEVMRRSK